MIEAERQCTCPSLEDLLQRHFGLEGELCLTYLEYTKEGYEAYTRMVDFMYDLAKHVEGDNPLLAQLLSKQVDIFDEYEHTNY